MNPYLPLYEYIPDGEPHVFNHRIYLFGSHDRFDGEVFCQNDYVSYSADVKDTSHFRYEGVIYKKEQDPRNKGLKGLEAHYMWAPDVVKGLDGRYYLYYCMDVLPEIAVAVCDEPAGHYEFYGFVHHKDGTPLGCKEGDLIQFDPGVFIDHETIYLYSGNAPRIIAEEDGHHHSQVMTLEKDMLTLKALPKPLMPSIGEADEAYKGHEFFEASSIRKIKDKYYFIYSDVQSNSLSYAISNYPDKDYHFAGRIIALGDTGLNGRTRDKARNFLGNTHGSIECINDEWYVFYHRQTNRNLYSRQSCVEHISFDEKGFIIQPEMTSLGFEKEPLKTEGEYNAAYACMLWGKKGVYEYVREKHEMEDYPYFTQIGLDRDFAPFNYIANMCDGSSAGYKYFNFDKDVTIILKVEGNADGKLRIYVDDGKGNGHLINDLTDTGKSSLVCEISLKDELYYNKITEVKGKIKGVRGKQALYVEYAGKGSLNFYTLGFEYDQKSSKE